MNPIPPNGSYAWLEHTRDGSIHFDLVLEGSELCPTFQFKNIDSTRGERIKDHRKIYLTFEGQISPEKGSVKIYEKGQFTFDKKSLILTNGNKKLIFELNKDFLEKQ